MTILPPKELAPRDSWRDVCVNMAAPTLLFVLLNLLVAGWLSSHPVRLTTFRMHAKWQLLGQMVEPAGWLVVGDSSGNQGLMTTLLEERLGGRAFNLCTTGPMGLVDDLWMVEEHLRRLGPPGNLIILHVYDSWRFDDGAMRGVLRSYRPPIPDWLSREPHLKYPLRERVALLAAQYFPLYSQNQTLKFLATRPRNIFSPPEFEMDRTGFMPRHDPAPESVLEDLARDREFLAANRFLASSVNRRCLRRLLELADRHAFTIYIVNGPVCEDLEPFAPFREYWAGLQSFLAAETSGFDNARVIFTEPAAFPVNMLERSDHLTAEGARIYTLRVIREIEESRPAPPPGANQG